MNNTEKPNGKTGWMVFRYLARPSLLFALPTIRSAAQSALRWRTAELNALHLAL